MGKLLALSALTAITLSPNAWGAAFDNCPAQAFLTQGTVPTTYTSRKVNLIPENETLINLKKTAKMKHKKLSEEKD